MAVMDTVTVHKDGVPWYVAPLPVRWHSCATHSQRVYGVGEFGVIEWCRCGGERAYRPNGTLMYDWVKRNARRKTGWWGLYSVR